MLNLPGGVLKSELRLRTHAIVLPDLLSHHSYFPFGAAMRRFEIMLAFAIVSACAALLCADEPIYSGPQKGEKLASFKVRGIFDDEAGKEMDFVEQATGQPIVLIFVHDANRPSIGLTRILSSYTVSRAKDGLCTGIIWLADDA